MAATPSPGIDAVLDRAIHDLAVYGLELLISYDDSSIAPRTCEFVLCMRPKSLNTPLSKPAAYRCVIPVASLLLHTARPRISCPVHLVPGHVSAGVENHTALRSGGVRVSVWTRAACVKTSGPLLQRTDESPWNMGNKQRGLRRFRFRPSGILACPRPTSIGYPSTRGWSKRGAGRGSPIGDCVSR